MPLKEIYGELHLSCATTAGAQAILLVIVQMQLFVIIVEFQGILLLPVQ